ncbi:MAG: tetratricopeptide repeat protein [Betaproteobacteria bacterium]|nr:tetratricopeptide repeat protein [Betaproteobacteria bacterium]
MSLLLDALRRAEEAKRAKQGSGDEAAAGAPLPPESVPSPVRRAEPPQGGLSLALEPASAPSSVQPPARTIAAPALADRAPANAPATEFALADLDSAAPLPSASAPPPSALQIAPAASRTGPVPGDDHAQREQVRNAFAAKASPSAGRPRKWLAPVLAVGLVAVGGGGWYVWTEIQRLSKPMVAQAPRPAPAPPPAAVVTPPATAGAEPASAPTASPTGEVKAEPGLPPLLPPPPPEAPKAAAVQAAAAASRHLSEAEKVAKAILGAAPKAEPPLALKPSTVAEVRVNPHVAAAYAALQSGDLRRAASEYDRAVAEAPLNVDAHLGRATVAARSGDRSTAVRHYQEVLTIDPRNTYALSGLLALRPDRGADRQEEELRSLLAQNPEASALHFALGNLLAGQRRWQEAQQAFFDAWRAEPERADYAYNLAISLDQLKQPSLARDYYAKALSLARTGGAQFDPAPVIRRLAELGGSAP